MYVQIGFKDKGVRVNRMKEDEGMVITNCMVVGEALGKYRYLTKWKFFHFTITTSTSNSLFSFGYASVPSVNSARTAYGVWVGRALSVPNASCLSTRSATNCRRCHAMLTWTPQQTLWHPMTPPHSLAVAPMAGWQCRSSLKRSQEQVLMEGLAFSHSFVCLLLFSWNFLYNYKRWVNTCVFACVVLVLIWACWIKLFYTYEYFIKNSVDWFLYQILYMSIIRYRFHYV